MAARILVTASRTMTNIGYMSMALDDAFLRLNDPLCSEITVIHGDAPGGDQLAMRSAHAYGCKVEGYPARDFDSPRIRNQYMVDLGADFCLVYAGKWTSGSGMCARMARRAGILTVDYGVSTDVNTDIVIDYSNW